VKKSFGAARVAAAAILSIVAGLGLTACSNDDGGGSPNTVTNTGVPEARLYAVNKLDNSVMVFTLDSVTSGSRRASPKPVATIQGADTGLNAPTAVAVDAQGYIYVANSTGASVTVYAPGSDGNAAPQGAITGAATLLQAPTSVALDRSGNIYVANGSHIYEFPAGQGGNVAPIRDIELQSPYGAQGIAVDGYGDVFATAVASNRNPDTVFAYAPDSSGPYLALNGSQTGLDSPDAIALDANGSIIVANAPDRGGDSITVYTSSNADSAPSTTISGLSANLSTPAALLVDGNNSLYAANYGSNQITIYGKGTDGSYTLTTTANIRPTSNSLSNGLSGIALGP
jgi:6-phosphogluconolactonase (cycloisomerase 2 family)